MNAPSWREHVKVHPAADLFPIMSDAELDELASDIAKHGLYQAIAYQGDELLDGRNRLAAIHRIKDEKRRNDLLGFVASTKRVLEVSDPFAYVISANVHRRHLTVEQKRAAVAALLRERPERSDRETANIAGSNRTTVGQVRRELEEKGEVSIVDTRTDAAGRQQPARRPPKPPSKEGQIRSLRERHAEGGIPTAATPTQPQADPQPPPPDLDELKSVLAMLRGDPGRISNLSLEKRVALARVCLAFLNLSVADLRDSAP